MATTPMARAARARRRAARFVRDGLLRIPSRREREFTKVFTDADDLRDLAQRQKRRRSWSLRRTRSREKLERETGGARSPDQPVAFTFFGLSRRVRAVNPNSAFKRRWDYLTSVLAVLVVFAPEFRSLAGYLLGLQEPKKPVETPGFLGNFVNLWFLCDVLLNFVTGYVDRSGVLIMSKRRIALHYLQTYFLLDFWCALPFDALVVPHLPVLDDYAAALQRTTAQAQVVPCAKNSVSHPLVDCLPRRGPIRTVRNVVRHVRSWTPRVLSFAKRRGRLRQVLVSAPNIVSYIVRTLRLVRLSRVKLVKWRTIAVLGRRYRKNAAAYFAELPSPWRSPRNRDDTHRKAFPRTPSRDKLRRVSSKDRLARDGGEKTRAADDDAAAAAAAPPETPARRRTTTKARWPSMIYRPPHHARSFSE